MRDVFAAQAGDEVQAAYAGLMKEALQTLDILSQLRAALAEQNPAVHAAAEAAGEPL